MNTIKEIITTVEVHYTIREQNNKFELYRKCTSLEEAVQYINHSYEELLHYGIDTKDTCYNILKVAHYKSYTKDCTFMQDTIEKTVLCTVLYNKDKGEYTIA